MAPQYMRCSWSIDVKFSAHGMLQATARGVLALLDPAAVLELVTSAGVQRSLPLSRCCVLLLLSYMSYMPCTSCLSASCFALPSHTAGQRSW